MPLQHSAIFRAPSALFCAAGFSLVLGLLGALDTLCGQAWGEQRQQVLGTHIRQAGLPLVVANCAQQPGAWFALSCAEHKATQDSTNACPTAQFQG